MRRVVHVAKMTGVAGMERHLLTLLPALVARGVAAQLALLFEPDKPMDAVAEQFRAAGVATCCLPIRADIDPLLVVRLRAYFRTRAPVLVHTHVIQADMLATIAARWAGVPCVVSTRHYDYSFTGRRVFRWLYRVMRRWPDAVAVISHAIARLCTEVEGVPRERVQVIHYGIELPKRVEPVALEPGDWFCVVGRLIPLKGHACLLRAFARVKSMVPSARLLVIGDGPERGSLERLVSVLELSQAVRFAGWVADVLPWVAACNAIVQPSLAEGLGLTVLEAMTLAKPAVVTEVGGLPELVVDGETGLVVPPGDEAALAAALAAMLQAPGRLRQWGQAARRRVKENFTVDRMTTTTIELYQHVLEGLDT